VTQLSIVDQFSVRWRVSVDFTIPETPSVTEDHATTGAESERRDAAPLYVPIALVAKRKLADIDLEDETGRRLSVIDRDTEAQLTVDALVRLWYEYCKSDFTNEYLTLQEELPNGTRYEVTASALAWLTELVTLQPKFAEQRLGWMRRSGLIDRIGDATQREYFDRLLELFVTSGVLYTILYDAAALERRVLKLTFRDLFPEDTRQGSKQSKSRRSAERILQSLGMRSTPITWDHPAGQVGSLHIECKAPDGLVFIDSLIAEGPQASHKLAAKWNARFNIERLDQGIPGSSRIHLYRDPPDGSAEPLATALYLRPPPTGWLLAAFAITFLVALSLTLIATQIETLYRVDRATSVSSLLLALGAVVVVFLARPLEHGLTARLLRGARASLSVSAIAALVAIALLTGIDTPGSNGSSVPLSKAVGMFYWARWWIVVPLAWASCGVIGLSLLSWYVSTTRLRGKTPGFLDRYAARTGLTK
jgi:hypothetical protein